MTHYQGERGGERHKARERVRWRGDGHKARERWRERLERDGKRGRERLEDGVSERKRKMVRDKEIERCMEIQAVMENRGYEDNWR